MIKALDMREYFNLRLLLSFFCSLVVNDISSVVQQHSLLIRFIPYIILSAVAILWYVFMRAEGSRRRTPITQGNVLSANVTRDFIMDVIDNSDDYVSRFSSVSEGNLVSRFSSVSEGNLGSWSRRAENSTSILNHRIGQVAGQSNDVAITSSIGAQELVQSSEMSIERNSGVQGLVQANELPVESNDNFRVQVSTQLHEVPVESNDNSNAEVEMQSHELPMIESNSGARMMLRDVRRERNYGARMPLQSRDVHVLFAILYLPSNESQALTWVATVFLPNAIEHGSKILHTRLEFTSEGHLKNNILVSQLVESMRRAHEVDVNSTLQLGNFAILKHTDNGLQSWKLEEDWTPVIVDFQYSKTLLDFITGRGGVWIIKGFHLENAILKVSTENTSEKLNVSRKYKTQDGEEVLICDESYLVQKINPMFNREKVYLSATKTVEVEVGVTFVLRSEPKNIQKEYWIANLDGLIFNPWTMIVTTCLAVSFDMLMHFAYGMLRLFVTVESKSQEPSYDNMYRIARAKMYTFFLNYLLAMMVVIFIPLLRKTMVRVTGVRSYLGYSGELANTTAAPELVNMNATTELVNKTATAELTNTTAAGEIASTTGAREPINMTAAAELVNTTAAEKLANAPPPVEPANTTAAVELAKTTAAAEVTNAPKEPATTIVAAELVSTMSAASTGIVLPVHRFSNLRRNRIQSVSYLQQISDRRINATAKKVFSRYVYYGLFDNQGISDLLCYPISALPMLRALKDIAIAEQTCLVNENTPGIVTVLSGILGDERRLDTGETAAAARALGVLFWIEENRSFVISKFPGVLEAAMRTILTNFNPRMQNLSCRMLADLSYSQSILQYPGTLPCLVTSLTQKHNPGLQEQVATALSNLACGEHDAKLEIVNFPMALEKLVQSLSTDNNPGLQQQAARALSNLACGDQEIKLKIRNFPGALEKLVQSLSKDNNPGLQRQVVVALDNLACGDHGIHLKIMNLPRALEELAQSSFNYNNPGHENQVAVALDNLASVHHDIQLKVMNLPRALEELVQSLSKDNNPDLEEQVAVALGNLASVDHDTKLRLANFPGGLRELVQSLSKDNNPGLQDKAASVFCNLANGNHDTKLRIVNFPGALQELVRSLSKDNNPGLPEKAAKVFCNLANGDEETKLKIVNFPWALVELVRSLSKDNNPDLQEKAARVFCNLANGDQNTKSRIVNFPGALAELERSLSKHNSPGLQEKVASTLCNLANGDHDTKLRIVNFPRALEKLALSLSNEKYPRLQLQAAHTLYNLSYASICIRARKAKHTKIALNTTQGLMDGLVGLLATDISPDAQWYAAATLTLIDSARGNDAGLYSVEAYSGRGHANLVLGGYQESLADLDKAIELEREGHHVVHILSDRCTAKAKLGDVQGALTDANRAIEIKRSSFYLQERGVVRRIIGDLRGALEDFDEGLHLETDNYERLKHRGYVKFLMQYEDGARADAKWALRVKPPSVDDPGYGRDCLGTSSVEYLDYKLR